MAQCEPDLESGPGGIVPEEHAVFAPSPQINQLEAVVTATAEQLPVISADVQRCDLTLNRKFLNAAEGPV